MAEASLKRRLSATDAKSRLASIQKAIDEGLTVALACEAAGVAVPTYYRWQRRFGQAAGEEPVVDSKSAIIEAAKSLFLDHGLDTTLEAVALRAEVARQTVYNQFGSKQNLFKAVMLDVHEGLTREALLVTETEDLRATLLSFGRSLVRMTLDPQALAFFRIAISEFRRMPELGRISYELRSTHILPKLTERLTVYLRQGIEAGTFRDADSELLAEAFFGAVIGYDRNRLLAGIDGASSDHVMRRIAIATDLLVSRLTPKQD